ncbi:MAG TPA: porin, partial [Gammaproteobacteria bacterium]|nr:porin [Gammaproteobacteria bacterium]
GYLIYVGNGSSSTNQYNQSEPDNTKAGGYDIAASYSNGPIKGWVAYETQKSEVSNSNLHAWRVSGSYNMNPFKVGAIYENVNADSNFMYGPQNAGYGDPINRNAWGLFGMMNLGMNDIGVSYYNAQSSSAGSNNGADMWVLGAYHHFSKQTSVYAMYASMNNDNNGLYALGQGGHGQTIPVGTVGDNPSAFSVGFTHKF